MPRQRDHPKHAEEGGFPANRIEEVQRMISPVTAEGKEQSISELHTTVIRRFARE
jgi:hypothetical protein